MSALQLIETRDSVGPLNKQLCHVSAFFLHQRFQLTAGHNILLIGRVITNLEPMLDSLSAVILPFSFLMIR